MEPKLEGVMVIYNGSEIVAFIVKDPVTKHPIFFAPKPMGMDQIAAIIKPGFVTSHA